MKTSVALTLLIATAAMAQGPYVASSNDGNLRLSFKSISRDLVSGSVERYVISGGIEAVSKAQGLKVIANQATVLAKPLAGKTSIQDVVAKGNVSTTKSTDVRVTTITSANAHIVQGLQNTRVEMKDAVKIVDSSLKKGQKLVVSGSSGEALLMTDKAGKKSSIRTATLRGPVTVEVTEAAYGKRPSGKVMAHGDSLTINNVGATPVVTLVGNVRMQGTQGSQAGQANVDRLVLRLNQDFELVGWQAGAR